MGYTVSISEIQSQNIEITQTQFPIEINYNAVQLDGEKGDTGAGYSLLVSTSTNDFRTDDPTKTWSVSTANIGAFAVGDIVRVINVDNISQFVVGQITEIQSQNGTSDITVLVISAEGEGASSNWRFALTGLDGTGSVPDPSATTTIISESAPLTASQGELWYNPANQVLSVYVDDDWQTVGVDDLQF